MCVVLVNNINNMTDLIFDLVIFFLETASVFFSFLFGRRIHKLRFSQ